MRNGLRLYDRKSSPVFDAFADFDGVFGRMFPEIYQQRSADAPGALQRPSVDVSETEKGFLISADMPGVKKEDLKIEVKDGILNISGERKKEDSRVENGVSLQERFYGKYQRSFSLPETVDADSIEASFEHGVLEVMIPKSAKTKPKTIEVQAKREGLWDKLTKKEGKADEH